MIQGVITTKHVLFRAPLILRDFGIRVWLSCFVAVLSGRRTTFLEVIWA
jgi:hypothetical protein